MAAITTRTGLATISLGSGPSADVLFVFGSDICGESERTPRHARVYGNLASLYAQVEAERIRALSAFRVDVASGSYPNDSEMGHIDPVELERFITSFDC